MSTIRHNLGPWHPAVVSLPYKRAQSSTGKEKYAVFACNIMSLSAKRPLCPRLLTKVQKVCYIRFCISRSVVWSC